MRRFRKRKDPLKVYRKYSPDYWLEVAKRAYAEGIIDQSIIDRILAQSTRGLIPASEYGGMYVKDWDICSISMPLYDYWINFIPYNLR